MSSANIIPTNNAATLSPIAESPSPSAPNNTTSNTASAALRRFSPTAANAVDQRLKYQAGLNAGKTSSLADQSRHTIHSSAVARTIASRVHIEPPIPPTRPRNQSSAFRPLREQTVPRLGPCPKFPSDASIPDITDGRSHFVAPPSFFQSRSSTETDLSSDFKPGMVSPEPLSSSTPAPISASARKTETSGPAPDMCYPMRTGMPASSSVSSLSSSSPIFRASTQLSPRHSKPFSLQTIASHPSLHGPNLPTLYDNAGGAALELQTVNRSPATVKEEEEENEVFSTDPTESENGCSPVTPPSKSSKPEEFELGVLSSSPAPEEAQSPAPLRPSDKEKKSPAPSSLLSASLASLPSSAPTSNRTEQELSPLSRKSPLSLPTLPSSLAKPLIPSTTSSPIPATPPASPPNTSRSSTSVVSAAPSNATGLNVTFAPASPSAPAAAPISPPPPANSGPRTITIYWGGYAYTISDLVNVPAHLTDNTLARLIMAQFNKTQKTDSTFSPNIKKFDFEFGETFTINTPDKKFESKTAEDRDLFAAIQSNTYNESPVVSNFFARHESPTDYLTYKALSSKTSASPAAISPLPPPAPAKTSANVTSTIGNTNYLTDGYDPLPALEAPQEDPKLLPNSSGANCWAASLAQCIATNPLMRASFEACSATPNILDQYKTGDFSPLENQMRSNITDNNGKRYQDPLEALEYLTSHNWSTAGLHEVDHLHSTTRTTQSYRIPTGVGAQDLPFPDATVSADGTSFSIVGGQAGLARQQLPMIMDNGHPVSGLQLIDIMQRSQNSTQFTSYATNRAGVRFPQIGETTEFLDLDHPPEVLIQNLSRPDRQQYAVTIPERFIHPQLNEEYQLRSFLVHRNGHWVAYVKIKQDGKTKYLECNNNVITPVTRDTFLNRARRLSSVLFWNQVTGPDKKGQPIQPTLPATVPAAPPATDDPDDAEINVATSTVSPT